MAKELPFFKFEPAEYLTKDISFCSLSAQGLFINLCSYYWQRNCELTKDQLLKRLNHEKELNELISEGVIDLIENKIKIKFLDKQLNDVEAISNKNSVNGSKGGRPKKNPTESQNKAKINPTESQTKGIREDKIILDEIKEEEIKEIIINNDFFSKECSSSGQWIDVVAKSVKILPDAIPIWLSHFNDHLIIMQEQKKELSDYKNHFASWLRKQDISQYSTQNIGKTNQV